MNAAERVAVVNAGDAMCNALLQMPELIDAKQDFAVELLLEDVGSKVRKALKELRK